MPPRQMTPTSVVPPPMSTTIEPEASLTPAGRRRSPRPWAPRSGRRRWRRRRAPISRIARRSTWVEPQGTQMMMRGLGRSTERGWTILMNCLSICSVTVKSAITPSFIGRMASMLPGTLPSMALASLPTAWMVFLPLRAAFVADGDDRGLVEHDALAAHVDQRVGGAEVDGEVGREIAAQGGEHGRCRWVGQRRRPASAVGRPRVGTSGSGGRPGPAGQRGDGCTGVSGPQCRRQAGMIAASACRTAASPRQGLVDNRR